MDTIQHLLNGDHQLFSSLNVAQILQFITHASCLKGDILLVQPSHVSPETVPTFLPEVIQDFLSEATAISIDLIPACWTLLGHLAWNTDYVEGLQQQLSTAFMRYGINRGLSECNGLFAM